MNRAKDNRKLLGIVVITFFAAIALCVIFGGCIPATREAGIRRVAEHKLATCRQSTANVDQRHACNVETREYCRARGLEGTCGEGW